ncbi:hypothetical protein MWH30_07400 [Fuchsiella alkaliacetigena]|nr:hypothetical protein [Fuchsiella alkaliacetigena]
MENKITFQEFEEEFFNQKIRKEQIQSKISPETAWHVIRSYIKGRRYDDYLTPEEYQGIARKDKTVDSKIYQLVYDRVWSVYKDFLKEEGKWDQQDLVRDVLSYINRDGVVLDQEYLSIFCDEAQDFTKIELKFILQLSAFSKYNLREVESFIQVLPFAFAGDPLQTITPTGFRWDRFKEMLYNELKNNFNLKNPNKFTQDSKFTLHYNYRSAPEIVNFSNRVQFFRKEKFGEQVKPQEAWFEGKGDLPKLFLFTVGEGISEEEFIEYADNTVIITPFSVGGLDKIAEKVEGDPLLGRIAKKNEHTLTDDGVIGMFTSLTAKGLEFDKVIIYKFGDYLGKDLLNSVEETQSTTGIEIEYFINRLYVALTRAKKQLIIVDSTVGREYLWDYFENEALEEMNSEEFAEWFSGEEFALLKDESPEVMEEKHLLKVAHQLKKKGILNEDPILLRNAQQLYETEGEAQEAEVCAAWYHKFKYNYLKAGKLFQRLSGENERALECFWQGEHWTEIKKWYDSNPGRLDKRYKKIAEFMLLDQEQESIDKIDLGKELLIDSYDELEEEVRNSKQFEQVKQDFFRTLADQKEKLPSEQLGSIAEVLDEGRHYLDYNVEEITELIFELYYTAGEYQQTVDFVAENDLEATEQYYRAKTELSFYPDTIDYLYRLEDYEQVIKEYEANNKDLKSKERLQKVGNSYLELDKVVEAAEVYIELQAVKKVEVIYKKNISYFKSQFKENDGWFFTRLFDLMLQERRLGDVFYGIIRKHFGDDWKQKVELCKILFKLIATNDYFPQKNVADLSQAKVRDFFDETKRLVFDQNRYNINIIEASLSYEKVEIKYKWLLGYYEELLEIDPGKLNYNNDVEYEKQLSYLYSKKVGIHHFPRTRWLHAKKKFIEISDKMSEERAQEHQTEIEQKLRDWGLTEDDIPTGIPSLVEVEEIELGFESEKEVIRLQVDTDDKFKNDMIYGELKKENHKFNDKVIDTLILNLDKLDAEELGQVILETKELKLVLEF